MYMHTLARFCESQRRFSLFSPLNIYISLFSCLPVLSLLPSLLLVLLLVPLLRSSSLPAVCPLSFSPFISGGLLCVVPCVLWWLPSLVRHQAQNGVTVWADAPRICPRPCLLLPMCCRVFRVLSRGFRPRVRVCVRVCVLPCVVWW